MVRFTIVSIECYRSQCWACMCLHSDFKATNRQGMADTDRQQALEFLLLGFNSEKRLFNNGCVLSSSRSHKRLHDKCTVTNTSILVRQSFVLCHRNDSIFTPNKWREPEWRNGDARVCDFTRDGPGEHPSSFCCHFEDSSGCLFRLSFHKTAKEYAQNKWERFNKIRHVDFSCVLSLWLLTRSLEQLEQSNIQGVCKQHGS
jgi:hypothetical protein